VGRIVTNKQTKYGKNKKKARRYGKITRRYGKNKKKRGDIGKYVKFQKRGDMGK
jgi:hypothetical protein